ncbi:DivIVA domain-containing protein [Actinoplanes sp. GCM10030250]|uniref:DivIVA domain-containing protein n=1 Tax=Actinoplanes sp. GCM10030250 TaxID=3273376 RepID=UPI00362030CB
MPLTPADIHNVEFPKTSLGKRGYDEEQVDALLDEVSQEMIRLLEENDALQRQARLSAAAGEAEVSGNIQAEFSAAAAELDRARRACDLAEQNARLMERQLDQARRSAVPQPPAFGGENLDRVMALAQRTADDHLLEAREESHALIADAQLRSEQIAGEARKLSSDIGHDAQRNHTEAVATTQARRADLLREIDELTRLAVGYRAALADHLSHQSERLGGEADVVST